MAEEEIKSPGFFGSQQTSIDGRNRVVIPDPYAQQLRELGGEVVVVTWFEGCLAIYPPSHFARIQPRLAEQMPGYQALYTVLDKEGGVTLTEELVSYASLKRG